MLYKRRWGREVSDWCVDGSVYYRAVATVKVRVEGRNN